MLDKLKRVLLGGADHESENTELLDNMTKEQLIELVKKQAEEKKKTDEELRSYKMALLKRRKEREENKKTIDRYTEINIDKWIKIFQAEDAKHQNPEVIQYDEDLSTFDLIKSNKNPYFKFRPYQQKFIEDWSIATNELVILYYGVGSGKTLIAINCGEQFINLNPDSFVYFLLPASLVINTIMKMYEVGLDPRRKNSNNEYVYKFISYQQMMLSKVDIKPNSLLIIDEAHNLRNFGTKEIKEKISARKWKESGNYSLMGNKVANLLLQNKNTFLRTIMMTGTLFCNSPDDIEALIGIGYKKAPLVELNRQDLLQIHNDEKQFDKYYGGLISFFRLKDDDPDFPRKKYHFIPIEGNMIMADSKDDPYFQAGRNSGMNEKCDWIVNFLTDPKRKNQKTLLYAEFMDKAITILMKRLSKEGLNVVEVTGSENIKEKQAGISLYNKDKIQLLVFSKAIKEGISFKETNNFIFIQPYWNYAISEQIIARAVRLDSHKQKQKSLVNIYCLIGVNPEDMKKYSNNELKEIYGRGVDLGTLDPSNKIEIIDCPEPLVPKQYEYMKLYQKQQEDEKKQRGIIQEKPEYTIKKWIKEAEDIMNNNIKTLQYERPKTAVVITIEKERNFKKVIVSQYFDIKEKIDTRKSSFSRDTYIWDMMFNKQENINVFEKKLLQPKLSFENYLTNENNEFIQEFNLELEKLNSDGKTLSRKQEIELKRKMYKQNYEKKILETNSKITRFSTDTHFKVNRNPDLQELAQNQFKDNEVEDKMKKLFNDNASLSKILEAFNIDKQQITNFQANFTSKDNIKSIIELSKIKDDKRDKIMVLEPTSGIGGVISSLLKECPNKNNFMIDSNEYHNVFYNFQKLLFKGIDNIFVYNTDFMTYQSKYEYDYILGNPPFNLRFQLKKIKKAKVKKIKDAEGGVIDEVKEGDQVFYEDTTLYDVDFVARAYNLLKNPTEKGATDGGVLCMIISNRFTRDNNYHFSSFKNFIEDQKKYDQSSVEIIETGEFDYHKENTEGTKEMTTKYPMVCIYLRKIHNITINLNQPINISLSKEITEKENPMDEATKMMYELEELKQSKGNKKFDKKPDIIDEELERELQDIDIPEGKKKKLDVVKFNLNEELKDIYEKSANKRPKKNNEEIEEKPKKEVKQKDMRGTRKMPEPKKEVKQKDMRGTRVKKVKDDEEDNAEKKAQKFIEQYMKDTVNKGNGKRSPYYYKTKGKGIIDTVKAFFTGRKDYPPNIRKFIEQNKDLTITNMRVGRRPIKSFITTVGNALTFGGLKDAMKKHSYDDLLHLWLEFTMSNGKSHIVEKDEVVKIGAVDNREGEKTNFMNVPIKNTVNVYDFFYKPLKAVGKNLIEYSAHKYNCQNFVMNLLKYSGNLNPELEKFIMQDVENMLSDPKFSLHKTFIKFITDAGAKIDVLKQGAGKNEMIGKGITDWLKKHKNKLLGLAGLAGVFGIKALHHKYLINKAEKEANEMMANYNKEKYGSGLEGKGLTEILKKLLK
jgi:hypothetical protein